MTTIENLNELLEIKSENEHIEFKEAKNEISILGGERRDKKCLLGYCIAFANEKGGKLILGIADHFEGVSISRKIVGTSSIKNIIEVKKQIYDNSKLKIEIEELFIEDKRIVIITIPSRPIGSPLKFYGIPLMRIGENLEIMDDETIKSIIFEGSPDYSAETIEGITIDDLDLSIIEQIKDLWAKKSGNTNYKNFTNKKLLEKLLLIRNGKVTISGLLLLGKSQSLGLKLPQSEIILEWRTDPNKLDYEYKKIWRNSFIKVVDEIWETINARNTRTPFKQGFIENDIWAYDKESIREAVLNAFAHREYRNSVEPIFIKLSPVEFSIKSPGIFLPGVTSENALHVEGKWRNRFLMEVLHEIGLVERSGIGLDRVFGVSIKCGKGKPKLEETSDRFVKLTLPAIIQDKEFISYLEKIALEKQVTFSDIEDLIEIDLIRKLGKYSDRNRIERFMKIGIVDKLGTGQGTKYFLNRKYYEYMGKKGEFTRKKGLSRESRLELLRNFFKDNSFGNMSDFKDVFDNNLDRKYIQRLLNVLRKDKFIYFDSKPSNRKGVWRIGTLNTIEGNQRAVGGQSTGS